MKKYALISAGILVSLAFQGCLRLDSFLFNPNTDIESYELDDFEGEQEFDLPDGYEIGEDMVNVFTLESDLDGDVANIYALYVGDQSTIHMDTVILYLHGNAGHMDFYWNRIKLLAHAGGKFRYGVMAIDYRGYGLSEGVPTEDGLYADTDAALQWLKERGLEGDRLVMYGFSMGTAPATELTSDPRTLKPTKLMVEAPFASDEVIVQDASGLALPGSFFSNLEIDNAEEIKNVQQPFYWIHGVDDDFLPMETHGEVMYKNYQGIYSEAHRIELAGHGDVPEVMGLEDYMNSVYTFIKR